MQFFDIVACCEKLPDPAKIPNVGSFFKNPVVVKAKVNQLLSDYPDMPYYSQSKDLKIPVAWLIEQCGYSDIDREMWAYDKQALVLVNFQVRVKSLLPNVLKMTSSKSLILS